MILKYVFFLSFITFLVSCSDNLKQKSLNTENKIDEPEKIYSDAMNFFQEENIILASENFEKLIKLYPLSNEAIQSEIMIGFISYLRMDYETAINTFDKIARKYPSLKNLDYVYYMRAMCNYEQINHQGLDGKYNELALNDFKQVINRFPFSDYADDSRQKIILIKSNKAAKHMDVGRFYLKKEKYIAALNRFKIVVDEYSMTKFSPEALYRMVEIYFNLGMNEEAYNTASVLGYNYPESKWYEFSYNLIKNERNKKSFIKNLFQVF